MSRRSLFLLAAAIVAVTVSSLPADAYALVGGGNDPKTIIENLYTTMIKPTGLGIAMFGVLASVFVFFSRGALPAVFTFVGGLLMGAAVFNADKLASLAVG